MWRKVAKFVVKALLGIAGLVWLAAMPSSWVGLGLLIGSTVAALILGAILIELDESYAEPDKEESSSSNH